MTTDAAAPTWAPAEIAELLALFAFSPDADNCDDLFWRHDGDGNLSFVGNCSDLFASGGRDGEVITPPDLPDLAACRAELADNPKARPFWPLLWIARRRGRPPLPRWQTDGVDWPAPPDQPTA